MQVRVAAEQHNVMIEAVENHMPEVIVIDEIGNELEALAARTIAERLNSVKNNCFCTRRMWQKIIPLSPSFS